MAPTKSYNREKQSAGAKVGSDMVDEVRWVKTMDEMSEQEKNVKWNELRGGQKKRGMRDRRVMLKWVCYSETTVGCQLLKWEQHWADTSVTSLTQSWQHRPSLAASVVLASQENMMKNNVHIIINKSKKKFLEVVSLWLWWLLRQRVWNSAVRVRACLGKICRLFVKVPAGKPVQWETYSRISRWNPVWLVEFQLEREMGWVVKFTQLEHCIVFWVGESDRVIREVSLELKSWTPALMSANNPLKYLWITSS